VVTVKFDVDAEPNAVKAALLHAAKTTEGVLPSPSPRVHLTDFCDSSVQYEVVFWVDCEEHFSDATDAVRTRIWYTAKERGLRMPFPTRTLYMQPSPLPHPADPGA
jgi:small-conductance mechanosensitive channel